MTGTFTWPPVIRLRRAAWSTICSKAMNSIEGIWNSQTGRRPAIAAPVAKPVQPASEIGASMIRSVPNSSTMPRVSPRSDWRMSSPSMKTSGSARISSSSPARKACR